MGICDIVVTDEVKLSNFRFRNATTLGDILCLATLLAGKPESFGEYATADDARNYWLDAPSGWVDKPIQDGCANCSLKLKCLAFLAG